MPFVILLRHGESEINAANRSGETVFCGQFDTPLTERGRQQARDAGSLLARAPALSIERAVSSRLVRAIDTLRLLTENLPTMPTILAPMPELNERSLGEFEGRTAGDVYSKHPEYRDHPDYREFRNHFEQQAPGGENLTEVTHRMWAAWQEIRRTATGNVLIVSHGTALQAYMGRALGLARDDILALKVRHTTPMILEFGSSTDDSLPSPGYRLRDAADFRESSDGEL